MSERIVTPAPIESEKPLEGAMLLLLFALPAGLAKMISPPAEVAVMLWLPSYWRVELLVRNTEPPSSVSPLRMRNELFAGTASRASRVTPLRIVLEFVTTSPAVPLSCRRPPVIVTAPIVVGVGAEKARVPPPLMVTGALMVMAPPEMRDSVFAEAHDNVPVPLTVMASGWLLVAADVWIVTLAWASWPDSAAAEKVFTPSPVAPAVVLMTTAPGSSSSSPVRPAGARRSADPWKTSSWRPDTSAKPPSPPETPPRAEIVPAKSVRPSAQTITSPPVPVSCASAEIVAPLATLVECAFRTPGSLPWSPPPISTVPPPSPPDASTTAPLPSSMRSATAVTWPPVPVAPVAFTSPSIRVTPAPSIWIVPPVSPEASVLLAAPSRTDVAALNTTVPPSPTRAWVAETTPSWRMAPP